MWHPHGSRGRTTDKASWFAPDPYVLEQANSARKWRHCQRGRARRAPPGYPVVAFSGDNLRTYLKEHLIPCGRKEMPLSAIPTDAMLIDSPPVVQHDLRAKTAQKAEQERLSRPRGFAGDPEGRMET